MDYNQRDSIHHSRDVRGETRGLVALETDDGVAIQSDQSGASITVGSNSDDDAVVIEVLESGDQGATATLTGIPLVSSNDPDADEEE